MKPSSSAAASAFFSAACDRPLDVVQHRQQVAQQRQIGVAEAFFEFAGGPLAVVVQFRRGSAVAVLGGLQFGAKLLPRYLPPPGARFRLRAVRGFSRRLRFRSFRVRGSRFRRAASLRVRRIVLRHASFSDGLVHVQNNSFSFSKKLFRVGLTWVFSISASCRRAASCSGSASRGTSTLTCTSRSPRPRYLRVGHAAALEREDLAALRAGGNAQLLAAVERGHLDRRPQRRLRVADRHLAEQVLPPPLEQRMLGDVDEAVAVAGRTAVGARLAFARASRSRVRSSTPAGMSTLRVTFFCT